MSILTHRIAEPLLEFGHGQQMEAPKMGSSSSGRSKAPMAAPRCAWASSGRRAASAYPAAG